MGEEEAPQNDNSLPSLSEVSTKIDFSPGTIVGQYALEEKIGAGGMGAVYLARHTRLKSRFFAIKFIKPEIVGVEVRLRFEAEIDALEKIQHPNFVFAHDAGEFKSVTYLVMEYVEGSSLAHLLNKQGTLAVAAASEIVRQVACGLQHAFEQGLVHRDIKPSNLVLSKEGTVKILDLGLARICDPLITKGLTGSLQILGTPDYMSPEQCRSAAEVDIRSDIYSLGCTLYRLVAGRAPFGDEDHSSIANKITAHLSEAPKPIQAFTDVSVPEEFVKILDKMLAKEPEQRFQTPDELRLAIEPLADESSIRSLCQEPSISLAERTITRSLNAPSVETDVMSPPIPQPLGDGKKMKWILTRIAFIALALVAVWAILNHENNSRRIADTSGVDSSKATKQLDSDGNEPPNEASETSESNIDNKNVVDPDNSKPTDETVDSTKGGTSEGPLPSERSESPVVESNPSQPAAKSPKKRKTIPKPSNEELALEVKQIFRNSCFKCHGEKRKEADLNLLASDTFVGEDGSVIPGDADSSYLFERIATDDEGYRMPEPPLEALSQSEIETVRQWIEAGAPAFPKDVTPPKEAGADIALRNVVGAEYVLSQIVEFVEKQPREDRPYFRFFSSNNALTAGATNEELTTQHQALAKAINHLSMQPSIVRPTVVDEGLGTIFAVDIRKLGWQKSPFISEGGFESDIDTFDLILLEYPYGVAFSDSTNYEKLWDLYMERSNMVRPIPYLRIDWFVSAATQFPLYEDILGLPSHLHQLEEMLGVDSEMNMRDFVAKRAGMTVSGVSQNNRVVERHPSRFGAYWKSYDFETSKGRQNMFVDPMHFDFAGGEMIFNLPNGLQGYLITDTEGTRINAAPTSIVTDKFAPDKTVRNGLACIRCHDKGIKRFADNIRPAIQNLPGGAMLGKKDILRLYPAKQEMDDLLDIDETKFLSVMEQVLGEPQAKEPLAEVSRVFIDNAIALEKAASELGLRDDGSLKSVFALPQFTRFGLASLTQGGVVRRDTWEDYYDRIVSNLGIGSPIAPIDGLIREDHLAEGLSRGLILKTNKRSNIFSPGEKLTITIENQSGTDLFIEMIGVGIEGNIERLSSVELLAGGQKKQFPDSNGLTVKPKLGAEKIIVFASPARFSPGILLRPKNDTTFVADRFVHEKWYQYDPSANPSIQSPTQLIKKTIKFQTR